MNTLREMRQVLESLGKPVTEFTGYSMKADGFSWGLVHDCPIRDGVALSPKDWRDYIKSIKAGLPPPEVKALIIQPTANPMDAVADALGLNLVVPIRKPPKKVEPQVECPWCEKTGGITGMKIHHFDRCKMKKVKKP
jgi:hypothetical protein